jgi:hypothetical protein
LCKATYSSTRRKLEVMSGGFTAREGASGGQVNPTSGLEAMEKRNSSLYRRLQQVVVHKFVSDNIYIYIYIYGARGKITC